MFQKYRRSTLLLTSSFLLIFLAGCGSGRILTPAPAAPFAAIAGNWVLAPTQPGTSVSSSTGVPSLTGSFTAQGDQVSGLFHFTGTPRCLPAGSALQLTGAMDGKGQLHLTSQPIDGAVYTVQGQISTDGRSLTGASYSLTGDGCSAASGTAAGTMYAPVSGTYTGTFTDSTGVAIPVSTTLTQSSTPDSNGQFHLTGNATFSNNPCFASPVLTDSLVTGSTLSASYTELQGPISSTVTATGTLNSNATMLTVSAYAVKGGACDGNSGTGVLTKQ